MMMSQELVTILCCPSCHSHVRVDEMNFRVICIQCKKEFLIKEGIPIMIPQQENMIQEASEPHGK